MSKLLFDPAELEARIALNRRRLSEGEYYAFCNLFSPAEYAWYGDKEGRALLAFVSHDRLGGEKIPCMEQMLAELPHRLNEGGYFGPIIEETVHEQQLSGHSWMLRGLCEHYEALGDGESLAAAVRIAENLYLPRAGRFSSYPTHRERQGEGGVSGTDAGAACGWRLSTDIGCAFMSIDGLSHVYALTGDPRIRALVDEMTAVYLGIDKVALRAQTHCTLSAARGMVRMYQSTEEPFYLDGARDIMALYTAGGGMSATYQNLNWWGRPDTWTEPCAIVDSLMLAGELYRITGEEGYRTLAARIYHNGLATAQRENGGAGTDSIVTEGGEACLYAKLFEAHFCCTMRLAEGLRYVSEHRDLFAARTEGCVRREGHLYADGDLLYAEVSGGAEAYAEHTVTVDGHLLCPIVKYYKVPRAIMEVSRQRILF